ncbi:hypothetical protein GCM10018790_17880 [Kitasatospora xanthocidica]|nr:hypothetical protein GCM10018790_17880 [Kitasatospora xanthocidica]
MARPPWPGWGACPVATSTLTTLTALTGAAAGTGGLDPSKAFAWPAQGSIVSRATSRRTNSAPTGRPAGAAHPGRGELGADAVMRTFNQPNV